MKLWTIHNREVLDILKSDGIFKADERYVDPLFLRAYEWIANYMKDEGFVDDFEYPIWAWYKYAGKHKKPDLRRSGHLQSGTQGVCIEFEVEENDILLSDFDMWHCVLNGWYLSSDEVEDEIVEKRVNLSRGEIQESWKRMFDLQFGCDNYWDKSGKRALQACITCLKYKSVTKVEYFIAR